MIRFLHTIVFIIPIFLFGQAYSSLYGDNTLAESIYSGSKHGNSYYFIGSAKSEQTINSNTFLVFIKTDTLGKEKYGYFPGEVPGYITHHECEN